jgi:hypothetical protein
MFGGHSDFALADYLRVDERELLVPNRNSFTRKGKTA